MCFALLVSPASPYLVLVCVLIQPSSPCCWKLFVSLSSTQIQSHAESFIPGHTAYTYNALLRRHNIILHERYISIFTWMSVQSNRVDESDTKSNTHGWCIPHYPLPWTIDLFSDWLISYINLTRFSSVDTCAWSELYVCLVSVIVSLSVWVCSCWP